MTDHLPDATEKVEELTEKYISEFNMNQARAAKEAAMDVARDTDTSWIILLDHLDIQVGPITHDAAPIATHA